MNDFFNLSDGSAVEEATSFDGGGGNFDPIPSGTEAKAFIQEAKWKEASQYNDFEFISLKWKICEGEYNNRVVFQKVKVCEADQEKRDKALKMLSAIDMIAGSPSLRDVQGKPTDRDLASCLLQKPMAIMLQAYDFNDNKGNWVSAVSKLGDAPLRKPEVAPIATASDFDEDVGF